MLHRRIFKDTPNRVFLRGVFSVGIKHTEEAFNCRGLHQFFGSVFCNNSSLPLGVKLIFVIWINVVCGVFVGGCKNSRWLSKDEGGKGYSELLYPFPPSFC